MRRILCAANEAEDFSVFFLLNLHTLRRDLFRPTKHVVDLAHDLVRPLHRRSYHRVSSWTALRPAKQIVSGSEMTRH